VDAVTTATRKASAKECTSGHAGLVICKVLRDWVELGGEKGYRMSKAEKAMNAGTSTRRGECAGRSIVEMMEDELDSVVERLMNGGAADDGRDPGRAEGMAFCIALIRQPYNPNMESVREAAMDRYERAQED
jgi:hypothetical protein